MKKGISPLIATVMLIAITVIIATIQSGWLTSFTKTQQDTIENRTSEIVDCTSADITIDDVYLDFTTNVSRVHIRNTGQVNALAISSAVLLTKKGSQMPIVTNLTNISTLTKGQRLQLDFNITNLTACSNFSKVTVTTSCPTIADSFVGTPSCVS